MFALETMLQILWNGTKNRRNSKFVWFLKLNIFKNFKEANFTFNDLLSIKVNQKKII